MTAPQTISLDFLFYNGDWHTKLLSALDLAKCEADSVELVEEIEKFEQVVLRNDECFQCVTVEDDLPRRIDFEFARQHVIGAAYGEDVSVDAIDTRRIALTLRMRGSKAYVHSRAKSILECGLRNAK